MKRKMLQLSCAVGVLALLACGAAALSAGDSLVTLSYLKNTFLPNAVQQGETAANAKLQETYDSAKATLDQLQKEYTGTDTGATEALYNNAFQGGNWSDGDVLTLPTGSGVMLLNGSATVTHNGAFIDVTAGSEVVSGGQLTANHRYLVGEDTTAKVTVLSGAAQLAVQAGYTVTTSGKTATPFYDVCATDWYYTPVGYVYQNQLFSGMDEHHFSPSAAMNRAMLMTVLYRMAGAPSDQLQAANVSFDDVAASAWYAPYVKWGAAQGITAGTSAVTFSPEQQVTRQQVVVLLYSFATNYLGLEQTKRADLSGYQDLGQASDWARDALSWAVAEGIVSSSSTDALTLSPLKQANRAEVAVMLRAFSEKIL
jgi:hypothetical protein